MTWDLSTLLAGLHEEIQQRLIRARAAFGHPVAKGDASEGVWLELLQTYLPARYKADKATVVDSQGAFSDQIDVVVYDRHYSPFILHAEGQMVVPAESVYAVFEAKQSANADLVQYAQRKAATVRRLKRTSLPIPHAGGVYPPRPLTHILAGLVTLESDWRPPFGDAFSRALQAGTGDALIDLGCVAAHGHYCRDQQSGAYTWTPEGRPATAFLFELIARLQATATVPMIDIRAYAKWLAP
ncbi:MAG TPA: DUF6602 domain-containing protein [Mesorhizobium sp.]|jgi:hypothetical protein|nr:DUF6602 domain-containing protein [Mesorhizobium sp.]